MAPMLMICEGIRLSLKLGNTTGSTKGAARTYSATAPTDTSMPFLLNALPALPLDCSARLKE